LLAELAARLESVYLSNMSVSISPPSVQEYDEPKLEAIIETMFLAAFADGDFSEEERQHFLKSVQSLTDRRLSQKTMEALMTRMMADLEASGRQARLKAIKERLFSIPGARKVALAMAIQIVAADGIIRTSEHELLFELAEALEIDRNEAADLVTRLTAPPSQQSG